MRACVFARCAVLGLLFALMASSSVWAQYELRSVAFNPLFQDSTGPAKAPGTDPLVPAPSQFASAKITGGSVAALYRREYGPRALPNAGATWSDSEAALAVTSSAAGVTLQAGDIVTLTGAGAFRETRSYNGTTWVIGNVVRYAAAVYTAATATDAGNAVVLVRAVLGAALQPDAPRYLFGEVIARPAKTADGTKDTTGDLAEYWLSRPMTPGEPFDLGDGTIHTPPGVTGSEPYYFSIHANAVFASQAGRVSITWRSRAKETFTNGAGASVTQFRIKAEDFFVSAASLRPSRTIFWTQKQFKGPAVSIPLGSIQVVRPIYNAAMPREVNGVKYAADGVTVIKDSEEYLPESGQRELPVEPRTLWFDSTTSALRAYNRTGRLMVEYLGEQQAQPIEPGAHVFLGADVVDVVQQAPQIDAVVELGERITPRDRGNAEVANSSAWIGRDSQAGQTGGAGYYHTVTLADGTKTFYAEKENLSPANVVFYWLERLAPALTTGAAAAVANITLEWPKQKNGYRLLWPEVDPANPASGLARYAHNTVATAGSPLGTGVQFAAGQLPLLAFQDGPAATLQAEVNTSTQRFTVSLSNDGLNRSLIRFGSGSNVWYVRVYTQAEDSAGFLEGDGGAAIRSNGVPNAIVGTRLQPPSADYISAGYIAHGRGYSEAAYVDPFVAGATLASSGAIIPVNAIPGDKDLVVWWFKVVKPPAGSPFQPFYVPAKLGRYTIGYPSNAPKIVMAADGNKEGGTPSGGELSTAQEKLGKLYVQNVRTGIGFNPNEEHALLSSGDGRVYALRDDINDTGSNPASYTSEPFILWSYKATDGRPAMKVFQVLRETAIDRFSYDARVPSPVRGPMPLGELDIPTDSSGASKNFESTPLDGVHQQPNLPATQAAYDRYNRFTWEDRNGQHWIYRGPHNDATSATALTMQFYYPMRSDFYLPPEEPAVAVGSPLPYLRAKRADGSGYVGTVTAGPPLNITFLPKWNPADPELEVTDTLTVAKDGLPAIYGQSSSEVLYQRSIAQGGPAKSSVVLYDPLREKEFMLGAAAQLQAVPTSALTTVYQGKTYFQGLPPHLQKRFFYDALRGPVGAVKGALVLKGQFIAGEDYLHLNVLTPEEEIALKTLVPEKDGSGVILPEKVLWDAAITGLSTQVETFVKNPAVPGKYKVGPSVTVNARSAAEVTDPDRLSSPGYAAASASETAVVNYALTATGKGDGWVTMVFGNGRNPDQTPAGNSVSVKTFRVRPRLYRGAVKVLKSDNPLDEKVTLRHTGAFMAGPTDTELPYEFEWRYLSASSASGKSVYTISASSLLGGTFLQVMNPTDALPTAAEYSGGQSVGSAPQIVGVAIGDRPIAVLKSVSGVDFTAGVPDNLIFSGEFGAAIGFTLYVEGLPVLTSNRVNSADSVVPQNGLIGVGLAKQYALPGHFFQRKINRVEIAVYAAQGANITVSASPVQFQLHALVDNVSGVWTEATVAAGNPALGHIITVGGNPSAPLGNPLLMLGDNYFTVRYRPKTGKIYRAPTINGADPRLSE